MKVKDMFKKREKKEKVAKIKEKTENQSQSEIEESQKEEFVSKAYKILKAPQLTEKAVELAKKNQYVFKVFPRANKIEIKKAIENLYGVNVLSVKIVKIPRKRKGWGRISGWRKSYKKAIVKIKEGQKIEIIPR